MNTFGPRLTHTIDGPHVLIRLALGDAVGEVTARISRGRASAFAWGLLADLDPREAVECGSPKGEGLQVIAERLAKSGGITVEDLRGRGLGQDAHQLRQAFMSEAKLAGHSLPAIGSFLGGRDHTTVIHGIRAHAARVAAEQAEAEETGS